MKVLYTAVATASGGRDGVAETSDGVLKVDLAVPRELGGPAARRGTNPEQLFACGYAACFGSAIQFVAQRDRRPKPQVSVKASVGIGPAETGGFALEVTLEVQLQGMSQAESEALVSAAHAVCPYSNATRGNIPVKLITTAVQSV